LDETAPAIATAPGRLIVTDGANSIVERLPITANVAASETTTSASWANLTTHGPAVTVTCGAAARVFMTADCSNNTAGASCFVSVDVSGATTSSPSDAWSLLVTSPVAGNRFALTYQYHVTGLTPGSNTFTMQYHVSTGTGTFLRRFLSVQPF
jgi:hypothetical protein